MQTFTIDPKMHSTLKKQVCYVVYIKKGHSAQPQLQLHTKTTFYTILFIYMVHFILFTRSILHGPVLHDLVCMNSWTGHHIGWKTHTEFETNLVSRGASSCTITTHLNLVSWSERGENSSHLKSTGRRNDACTLCFLYILVEGAVFTLSLCNFAFITLFAA